MDTAPHATRLSSRALIRVGGDDVRGFLQGLVTNDTAAVSAGAPRWAGLLTPQGKALFDFVMWDDGDGILIDCEAAEREALVRRLSIYRLRRAIMLEPVAGAVHWSLAAQAGAVADPRLETLGFRWLGDEGDGTADDAWLRHRLSLGVTERRGRAWFGRDAVARVQWQRTEWGQLHQGLLCRAGEYRAHASPVEGVAATGGRIPARSRDRGRAAPIPSWS